MGIDVCFIDGLDAQLAFPVDIISLVVMVIIVTEYSPRFGLPYIYDFSLFVAVD